MYKFRWYVAGILAAVIIALFFFGRFNTPAVTAGVTVRIDSVIVRDTVRIIKRDTAIRVSQRVIRDTVSVNDSTLQISTDMASCYSIEQDFPGVAHINVGMCSKTFALTPPPDLRSDITFTPVPDTLKTELRVDSVPQIVYKPPKIPTWAAITCGILAGALTVALIK
jgi:hypothetical protein